MLTGLQKWDDTPLQYYNRISKILLLNPLVIRIKSSTNLHEVVCDVLRLQARDSVGGSLRYVDSEVSGLQPTEVCEQVSGLLVQGRGRTRQDLEGDIIGEKNGFTMFTEKI